MVALFLRVMFSEYHTPDKFPWARGFFPHLCSCLLTGCRDNDLDCLPCLILVDSIQETGSQGLVRPLRSTV